MFQPILTHSVGNLCFKRFSESNNNDIHISQYYWNFQSKHEKQNIFFYYYQNKQSIKFAKHNSNKSFAENRNGRNENTPITVMKSFCSRYLWYFVEEKKITKSKQNEQKKNGIYQKPIGLITFSLQFNNKLEFNRF